MKKIFLICCVITLIAAVYSCKKTTENLTGTSYLDLPATSYVYSTQSYDPTFNQKAALGRVLFYDKHLSINNGVSCGSCHKQELGFADNVAFSTGYQGKLTRRNSKSISNLNGDDSSQLDINSQGSPLFWDGREDVLRNLVFRPVTNHVEMGIEDSSVLPAKLTNLTYYNQLFASAYGDNTITTARISECVATFMVSIQSHNTKFDRYAQGRNPEAFSALETEGYNLFITKYNCESCHHVFTSMYSDDDFKDIGLDRVYTDPGRGEVTQDPTTNGTFRVPSLRNVALSAPYMHDGRYKTLGEVIDHYSHNIQNSVNLDFQLKNYTTGDPMQMNISDQEKQALISFLNTMTDYTMITDPKFSNPFKVK